MPIYLLQDHFKVFAVLFTVFLIEHSIPQTFTAYQDITILLLTKFLEEFFTFSGHDSINDCTGGLFLYSLGQFKIVYPVRISPGQIYIGICLYKSVPD